MNNQLTPFAFGEKLVRVQMDENGDPWFVAKDVAVILGYRDAFNMVRMLDEDEKGTRLMSTPSGEQEMAVISESGLYAVCLRSERPEARPFRKWVTADLLPTLRKTGRYEMPVQETQREEELPPWPEDREQATERICFLGSEFPSERDRFVRMAFRLAEIAGLTEADDVYELSLCCAKLFHSREDLTFPAAPALPPDKLARLWRETRAATVEGQGKGLESFLMLYRALERLMEREKTRQELGKALSTLVAQHAGNAPCTFEITVNPRQIPA